MTENKEKAIVKIKPRTATEATEIESGRMHKDTRQSIIDQLRQLKGVQKALQKLLWKGAKQ